MTTATLFLSTDSTMGSSHSYTGWTEYDHYCVAGRHVRVSAPAGALARDARPSAEMIGLCDGSCVASTVHFARARSLPVIAALELGLTETVPAGHVLVARNPRTGNETAYPAGAEVPAGLVREGELLADGISCAFHPVEFGQRRDLRVRCVGGAVQIDDSPEREARRAFGRAQREALLERGLTPRQATALLAHGVARAVPALAWAQGALADLRTRSDASSSAAVVRARALLDGTRSDALAGWLFGDRVSERDVQIALRRGLLSVPFGRERAMAVLAAAGIDCQAQSARELTAMLAALDLIAAVR